MIVDDRPVYPPEYDDDPPCLICGRDCDDCPCPECPECGEKGNPECQGAHGEKHGLVWTLEVCPTCKGQKVSMPDPEYGGDPQICFTCSGRGEVLRDFPPRIQILGQPARELTREEDAFVSAEMMLAQMYENLVHNWCVRCQGHGHTLSECPRRDA